MEKALLSTGTSAMNMQTISSLLSHVPFFSDNSHVMVPTIPNSGSQPPSDDHLTSAPGKNTGRAGRSGGKKKHWMTFKNICSLP